MPILDVILIFMYSYLYVAMETLAEINCVDKSNTY